MQEAVAGVKPRERGQPSIGVTAEILVYRLQEVGSGQDAVAADPEWTGSYVPRVSGLLVAQNTYLMNTAEFGPVPE